MTDVKRNLQEALASFIIRHQGDTNIMQHDGALCVSFDADNRKGVITAEVESVFYSHDTKGESRPTAHVGCPAFEGDILIDTMSNENIRRIAAYLRAH